MKAMGFVDLDLFIDYFDRPVVGKLANPGQALPV